MNIRKYLYHITPIENIDSIQKKGIKGKEKFLFKDAIITNIYHLRESGEKVPMTVRDAIATNQVGLWDKYAVFRVDISSIKNNLEKDLVAEFTSSFQFMTTAEITPDMVKFIGIFPNQFIRRNYNFFDNFPVNYYTKKEIRRLNTEA